MRTYTIRRYYGAVRIGAHSYPLMMHRDPEPPPQLLDQGIDPNSETLTLSTVPLARPGWRPTLDLLRNFWMNPATSPTGVPVLWSAQGKMRSEHAVRCAVFNREVSPALTTTGWVTLSPETPIGSPALVTALLHIMFDRWPTEHIAWFGSAAAHAADPPNRAALLRPFPIYFIAMEEYDEMQIVHPEDDLIAPVTVSPPARRE